MPEAVILAFTQGYLPGYLHGGPVRTLKHLIDRLGDEFEFRLVTADRDSGQRMPYAGVVPHTWQRVGKAYVYYAPPSSLTMASVRRIVHEVNPGAIYLNSFFSPRFSIRPLLLWRLRLVPGVPVILAPRGEFSAGALRLKRFKKRAYLAVADALGLYRHVIWQASSPLEAADIRGRLGGSGAVVVARNLTAPHSPDPTEAPRSKKVPGRLRLVFLSRIARMKNLSAAIALLDGVLGDIELDIYGPIEDGAYWAECERLIGRLPDNVRVRYAGAVPPDHVGRTLALYDLLLFPTLGENFGHVIVEALRAGRPALISDRTPWVDLESAGAGWSLPLDDHRGFREVLRRCVAMDASEHDRLARNARAYAARVAEDVSALEANRDLFSLALSHNRVPRPGANRSEFP